jgi:hypothetical protein
LSAASRRVASIALAAALLAPPAARAAEPFPASRPAGRAQAVLVLSGGGVPGSCLTPQLATARAEGAPLVLRRAERVLRLDAHVPGERTLAVPDGTVVRYTVDRAAGDRVDEADADRNGRPDAVDAVLRGLEDARALAARLELPFPGPADVLLAQLGGSGGYVVPPGPRGRALMVLDAAADGGAARLRAQALHQEAHRLVAASAVPGDWAEAFATFAELSVLGADDRKLSILSARLARLGEGLLSGDLALMAGNAAWFAFLQEAYGPTAVRLSVQELGATPGDGAGALDRALRRAVGVGLPAAFREFQVWSALVGRRDDGRHFPFAARVDGPRDAASAEGLPALSVQSDPAVASLGGATVRLVPGEASGGITVRFEGESGAVWESDLLVGFADGRKHLVPVPLDEDGRGEVTVPLAGTRELLLLVRNLSRSGEPPRRYTWSAHRERGYPYELLSLDVTLGVAGVRHVTWETSGERDLVGFDVVRVRQGTRETVRVNPVWIPSLGDPEAPAAYAFDDATADPAATYVYRVEAITATGLVSASDAILSRPPAP